MSSFGKTLNMKIVLGPLVSQNTVPSGLNSTSLPGGYSANMMRCLMGPAARASPVVRQLGRAASTIAASAGAASKLDPSAAIETASVAETTGAASSPCAAETAEST